MKKLDMTMKVVLIIGFISLIVGVYSAVSGSKFNEYLFPLFIGASLIGSIFLEKEGHLQEKDRSSQQKVGPCIPSAQRSN